LFPSHDLELAYCEWKLKQAAKEHHKLYEEIDRLQKIKHELENKIHKEKELLEGVLL